MPSDARPFKVLPVSHPKGCRSYVVVDVATREACVIDPLLDRVGETMRLLGEEGAQLRWAVDTHSHADHLTGAASLRERTGCDIVMHPEAPSEAATVRVLDRETLPLGEAELCVRHAPGNTADALVLEAPGAIFTGDTLLIGTVGLRDAPGADAKTYFETLHQLFDDRPDDTVVYPGHDDMGRTKTTLRQERTGNGWLREDDLDAFESRFERDDRPVAEEAGAILEANRAGLTRVPRDLSAASGFVDPAHRTEAALRGGSVEPGPSAPRSAMSSPGPVEGVLLLGGAAAVIGTMLGWLVHPICHAIAALAGAVMIGVALRSQSPRRRRGDGPSLYYEGPAKKTIGD